MWTAQQDVDSHLELRNQWLERGAPWFSRFEPYVVPPNWNAWDQVNRAGFDAD
jgi:hypothetical protein